MSMRTLSLITLTLALAACGDGGDSPTRGPLDAGRTQHGDEGLDAGPDTGDAEVEDDEDAGRGPQDGGKGRQDAGGAHDAGETPRDAGPGGDTPKPPKPSFACDKGDYGSSTAQIKSAADALKLRGYTKAAWVTITADDLKSLEDLGCLETIDGDLEVFDAAKLETLRGLEHLRSLSMIHFDGAPLLHDVSALGHITELDWADIQDTAVSACDLEALRLQLIANGVASGPVEPLRNNSGKACP
ncbi:MAG: hypothetical protein QM778_06925 [Myxococcales bacterium]